MGSSRRAAMRWQLSLCLGLLALLGGTTGGSVASADAAVLKPGREHTNEPLSRASRAPTHAALAEAHAASSLAARLAWANTWGEYREKHAAAMLRVEETGSLGTDRFLVCVFQISLGWGNRVTPIFTAAIIALLTNRVLLVRTSKEGTAWCDEVPVWDLLEPQLALKVSAPLAALLDKSPSVTTWSSFENGIERVEHVTTLNWTGTEMREEGAQVLNFIDGDYPMDLLKVNPYLAQFFGTYWPDGEVARHIWRELLRPTPMIEERVRAVMEGKMAGRYVVGVQIRSKKAWPRGDGSKFVFSDFFKAAEMAAHKHGFTGDHVRFFIAGDSPEVYTEAEDYFGADRVIRTDNGVGAEDTPLAGNPGNEASGLTDLMLLAMCDDLVLSWASSYGTLAAGISGVVPMYVWPALQEPPGGFKMQRVSRALTSEPIFANGPWFAVFADEGDRSRFFHHPEALRVYGSSGPPQWGNSTFDM
ncbi:hypothetical protein FOA52_011956 [Chlamydomonas sp. UWO 241]|nr:hypothetical protein FOA52_011956 [Chlamydomonas sp. UWO 241]